nr:hypothetical protein [Stigmatella erecta]
MSAHSPRAFASPRSSNLEFFAVLQPTRGQIRIDSQARGPHHILLAEIPRVGRHHPRHSTAVSHHLLHQRHEVLHVRCLVRQRLRHDDWVALIHRRLRVVALDEAALRLLDSALRVGEVALGLGLGFAVLVCGHLVARQRRGPGGRRVLLVLLLLLRLLLRLPRRLGLCFQLCLGLTDFLQPTFGSLQGA